MMIYTFTETGNGHANEDAIAHRPHPATDKFALCALADGQGGRSGGGIAAQAAVLLALDTACAMKPETLLSPLRWLDVCSVADTGFSVHDGRNTHSDSGYLAWSDSH